MIASLLFSIGFWLFLAAISSAHDTSMGLSLAAMAACTVLVVMEGRAA